MRFIRLTELIPQLLDMVDRKELAFNPAVELSYLKTHEQEQFLDAMKRCASGAESSPCAAHGSAGRICTRSWT